MVYIINACELNITEKEKEDYFRILGSRAFWRLVYCGKITLKRDVYIGHAKNIKYRLRNHLGTGRCKNEPFPVNAFRGRENYEKRLVEVGFLYTDDKMKNNKLMAKEYEKELINMDTFELEEMVRFSDSSRFAFFNNVPIRNVLNVSMNKINK